MSLRVVPVELKTAREFVAMHHRHNDPPIGHKFSVGVADGTQLVGVAIVGRPVSRVIQAESAGWDTPLRPRTNKADLVPRTLWDAVARASDL